MKSSFFGFDSSGKSINPVIISVVITAIPAAVPARGIGKDREHHLSCGRCHLGHLSLAFLETTLLCFGMWRTRGEHWPAAAFCPQRLCPSISLLTQVHSPGEDAGRAPWGGSSIPMVLLIHPIPAEPWRGTCRGHRAPLFPLTKGRLWLVRCPSRAAPHGPQ